MTVVRNLLLTGLLLAAAVALVQVVDRVIAARRRRAGHPPAVTGHLEGASEQGIRPANSGGVMILLTIAAAGAAAAAVLGFVGQDAQSERNASDDATVNRSTCLSTANADWRGSVGLLLMGYVAGDELAEQFVAAIREQGPTVERVILNGADTPDELRDRGAGLLASAVINDARIGDPENPLCPFVAGDPSRTPSEPDRSEVDFDTGPAPEITTTTSAPP